MELHELNRDLISGYHVRSTNHEELVKSLKLVNQIIQKAAHLRGKIIGRFRGPRPPGFLVMNTSLLFQQAFFLFSTPPI